MDITKNEDTRDKEQKVVQAAQSTLQIVLMRGIEGLTHAQLARSARVSRPWIYKYVGSTKDDLLEFAVDYFGKLFIELDQPAHRLVPEQWVQDKTDGFERMLDDCINYPWIVPIYYRYRDAQNIIGDRIRYLEETFLKRQSIELQSVFKVELARGRAIAETTAAIQMGLCHRWQCRSDRNPQYKEVLVQSFGAWLKANH